MIKIGITGHKGFLGQHLKFNLYLKNKYNLIFADQETFNSKKKLIDFVKKSHVIIHLASLNRGDGKNIYKTNVEITKKLINLIDNKNKKKHLIFSSSTQQKDSNFYGKSKKECSRLIRLNSKKNNYNYTNLIIPNVFGEFCKPNYNSFVSTFSYNLVNKIKTNADKNATVELIYVADLVEEIVKIFEKKIFGSVRIKGNKYKVREIYEKLYYFNNLYKDFIIPNLQNRNDLNLFNTYRSFTFPNYANKKLFKNIDYRGNLTEIIKTHNIGQVFYSSTKPNITRGNHFHCKKIERFVVIKGKAMISLRKILDKKIIKFRVSGNSPSAIDIPTYFTHSIKNIGDEELITLFWSNTIFDKKNTDTYYEKV